MKLAGLEILTKSFSAAISRRRSNHKFKLKDLAVGRNGLQPPWAEDDWAAIRRASYEDSE